VTSASGGLIPASTCTDLHRFARVNPGLRRPDEGLRRVGVLPNVLPRRRPLKVPLCTPRDVFS